MAYEDDDDQGANAITEDGAGLRVHEGDAETQTVAGGSSRQRADQAWEDDVDPDEEQPTLPEMGQLFGDPKKTLKNLIKAGVPVEYKAKLSNAEVPNAGGGLFDVETPVYALIRILPGAPIPKPQRKGGGDSKVTGWKVVQEMRVEHVMPVSAEDVAAIESRQRDVA